MVPAVIVEVDELPDRIFQFSRHIVRQLVRVPLQRLMIALQLPVGPFDGLRTSLRVVRCSEYVPDADQLKVLPEQSRDVAGSVVRKKPCPILHLNVGHARQVHGILDHLDQ